jgi:hypothetical protein
LRAPDCTPSRARCSRLSGLHRLRPRSLGVSAAGRPRAHTGYPPKAGGPRDHRHRRRNVGLHRGWFSAPAGTADAEPSQRSGGAVPVLHRLERVLHRDAIRVSSGTRSIARHPRHWRRRVRNRPARDRHACPKASSAGARRDIRTRRCVDGARTHRRPLVRGRPLRAASRIALLGCCCALVRGWAMPASGRRCRLGSISGRELAGRTS